MNSLKLHVKGKYNVLRLGTILCIIGILFFLVMSLLLNLTSSNAVLYFVRGDNGLIEVKNDLLFEESDKLLFMVNASSIFEKYFEGRAVARGTALLETTWDEKEGRGVIKEYRNDGTKFLVTFSRFKDLLGMPQGLFIGGDPPYGDVDRDKGRNNSGIGHYDGRQWHHIWCAMNEGYAIKGIERVFYPEDWKYKKSRIIKARTDEVILESTHEIEAGDKLLRMVRTVSKKAGTDFVLLRVKFINESKGLITLNYSIGDEPWIGDYASSAGDVGWTASGLIKYESFISPVRNRYAGFVDMGNDVIGEQIRYTGVANFVEWMNTPPSVVYFSNDFDFEKIDEKRPLESYNNRVINLSWIQQDLFPGDSREYLLALGMASINKDTGMPEKPVVRSYDRYRVQ